MPIHPKYLSCISEDPAYLTAVNALDQNGDETLLQQFIRGHADEDSLICGVVTEDASSYNPSYKTVFANTLLPKILPAVKDAVSTGKIPYIELSFSDLDRKRQELNLKPFGSPQDVLYTFTSDRAVDWGRTLTKTMFRSACMAGEAKVVVTVAPRFVNLSVPNFETNELEGAISLDFWESNLIVTDSFNFNSSINWLIARCGLSGVQYDTTRKWDAQTIRTFVDSVTQVSDAKVQCLISCIRNLVSESDQDAYLRKWNSHMRKKEKLAKGSQEQIALKYIEEGRFLQKLLGGVLVDHLQSNVKMQKNPLRGNKVEVDSIYRAIGRKQIILVEAKDNNKVSRTQLYSLYETYRLRLPQDWALTVVAALLSKPDRSQQTNISQIIDLVELDFDENHLGDIPESLFGVGPRKHYRWNIT
jgi:hypothetical protein